MMPANRVLPKGSAGAHEEGPPAPSVLPLPEGEVAPKGSEGAP